MICEGSRFAVCMTNSSVRSPGEAAWPRHFCDTPSAVQTVSWLSLCMGRRSNVTERAQNRCASRCCRCCRCCHRCDTAYAVQVPDQGAVGFREDGGAGAVGSVGFRRPELAADQPLQIARGPAGARRAGGRGAVDSGGPLRLRRHHAQQGRDRAFRGRCAMPAVPDPLFSLCVCCLSISQ